MSHPLTNIITAIRTKDFASANEGVTSLLQQKMADRLAQERKTLGESLLGEASVVIGQAPPLPASWKNGFQWPFQIGAGGKETPFLRNNMWYLRCWNPLECKHYLYNFAHDAFELEETYEKIGLPKEPKPPMNVAGAFDDAMDFIRKHPHPKQEDYDPAAEGERAGKLDGAIAAAVKRGDMDKAKELIKRGNADGRKLKLSDFLKEQALPKSDIQRVFNEVGDIAETKLLCGLEDLQVENGNIQSYRFVSEASGMNVHGVPLDKVKTPAKDNHKLDSQPDDEKTQNDRIKQFAKTRKTGTIFDDPLTNFYMRGGG